MHVEYVIEMPYFLRKPELKKKEPLNYFPFSNYWLILKHFHNTGCDMISTLSLFDLRV